jgi:hypothetical protein
LVQAIQEVVQAVQPIQEVVKVQVETLQDTMEHRIVLREKQQEVPIVQEVLIQVQTHTRCMRDVKGRYCKNHRMMGHDTCFLHTLKDPSHDDLQGFSSEEDETVMQETEFCSITLTTGRYKGFRCGNECEKEKTKCVFHLSVK